MTLSLNSERAVVALSLFLGSLALFWGSLSLPQSGMGSAFEPGFFPRIVLGVWIALAAINLVADLHAPRRWDAEGIGRVAVMIVLTGLYVVLMPRLGFFACSVVLSVAFLLLLGLRNPLGIVLVAVGVPGALVALFNHVLMMPLPTSPLFWWI